MAQELCRDKHGHSASSMSVRQRNLSHMVAERSVEQRNLQLVAYKNADGSRRASGRIITRVEYAKGNEQQAIHEEEYAVNLELNFRRSATASPH